MAPHHSYFGYATCGRREFNVTEVLGLRRQCTSLTYWALLFAAQGMVHKSLDDCKHIAGVHCRTRYGQYLLHHALFGRLDLILHFHSFHDDDALSGFDS